MSTTIIQLFAAGTATADDAAAVDIPEDGRISAIQWGANAELNASGESFIAELSFLSTNLFTQNDARGMISVIRSEAGLLTSGMGITAMNLQVLIEDLRVAGGERIHLHVNVSSGVAFDVACLIHLETGRALPRRSARRR